MCSSLVISGLLTSTILRFHTFANIRDGWASLLTSGNYHLYPRLLLIWTGFHNTGFCRKLYLELRLPNVFILYCVYNSGRSINGDFNLTPLWLARIREVKVYGFLHLSLLNNLRELALNQSALVLTWLFSV